MTYYIGKNGVATGPFEASDIAAKIRTGELQPADPCMPADGSNVWKTVATCLPGETSAVPAPAGPMSAASLQASILPAGNPLATGGFQQFLFLREMLTPTFIQVIYLIGLALVILSGLYTIFSGFKALGHSEYYGGSTPGLIMILAGFIQMVAGLIAWRIMCEILIVIFRMHDLLRDIRDGMKSAPPR